MTVEPVDVDAGARDGAVDSDEHAATATITTKRTAARILLTSHF
jgi:hypothetical protein